MQLLSAPVCSVPYKTEPYLMLYLALFKLDLSSGSLTNNIDVSTLTVQVKEAA
jgi:hypothetical protein